MKKCIYLKTAFSKRKYCDHKGNEDIKKRPSKNKLKAKRCMKRYCPLLKKEELKLEWQDAKTVGNAQKTIHAK